MLIILFLFIFQIYFQVQVVVTVNSANFFMAFKVYGFKLDKDSYESSDDYKKQRGSQ